MSAQASREPFAMLPESVLYADIPDRAKVLYGVYARFADPKGYCYPSQELLAARLGCSVAKVIRATGDLVGAKLISVQHRRGPNRVRLLAGMAPTPPRDPDGPALLQDVPLAVLQDVPDKNAIPSARPSSRKNARSELEEPENQSREGAPAQARESAAADGATGAQLRDGSQSEPKDDRDPLAVRLADGVGAPYEAALKKVGEWRAGGIWELLIDEAVGYALKHDGHTLAYVEKIVLHWWSQRNGPPAAARVETATTVGPGWYVGLDAELGPAGDALDPDQLKELIGRARRPTPNRVTSDGVSDGGPSVTPLRQQGSHRRDPVADELYLSVEDVDYAAALKAVKKLRAAGIPDDVILQAAASAADAGAPTLDYVAAVARTWGGADRSQDVEPPTSTNGNGHADGVA